MIYAGEPYAKLIPFSTGAISGAVSFQLLANDNTVLLSSSAMPSAGAVSHLISIDGSYNEISAELFERRTLTWSYTTTSEVVSGREVYRVERAIPFMAAPKGVRNKIGVEDHELEDDEIDLLSAYGELLSKVPAGSLTIYEQSGDYVSLQICHAIEATAALALLPSLQLKIAQRETGGTNEFQRYTRVDWEMIAQGLRNQVEAVIALVDPTYDITGQTAFTFGKVTPTPDPITGA